MLAEYDTLLAAVTGDGDPWVLTHGEPDRDNVVRTDDGHTYLIDWTSVAIVPGNVTSSTYCKDRLTS